MIMAMVPTATVPIKALTVTTTAAIKDDGNGDDKNSDIYIDMMMVRTVF